MKKFINGKNFLATIRNMGILLAGTSLAAMLEYGIISGTIVAMVLTTTVTTLATIELQKLNNEE